MADVADDLDPAHAASLGRRYLEDTLRSRPLWIRLIIEFLGTFILVTVAAGSGVINHYAGGNPVSRTAAVNQWTRPPSIATRATSGTSAASAKP